MACLITLFNKRFDNIDNRFAKKKTERKKLENEMKTGGRPRKRSTSKGMTFKRHEDHSRRGSHVESNDRTYSAWNDVLSKIPVFYKETEDFGLWFDKFHENVYEEG